MSVNIFIPATDQQPEGSNHGYTVLITLCDKLISGLSREPKALAYTLLGKGFLPQEKVEEIVQIPATDTQNARKIYDVVLGCVQHFPNRYIDFLSVLKGKGLLYGDLLTALKKAYLKLGENLSTCTRSEIYKYAKLNYIILACIINHQGIILLLIFLKSTGYCELYIQSLSFIITYF